MPGGRANNEREIWHCNGICKNRLHLHFVVLMPQVTLCPSNSPLLFVISVARSVLHNPSTFYRASTPALILHRPFLTYLHLLPLTSADLCMGINITNPAGLAVLVLQVIRQTQRNVNPKPSCRLRPWLLGFLSRLLLIRVLA